MADSRDGSREEIEKLRESSRILQERQVFEDLVLNISRRFVSIPSEKVDETITLSLGEISAYTGAERAYLYRFAEDRSTWSATHEWDAPGVYSQLEEFQDVPADLFR
ncbi:MAG: hypothetical protein HQL31_13195, partial [Planctomycetes bacterium]|nr:hypothetical protein [Planctomycetota bacterium]